MTQQELNFTGKRRPSLTDKLEQYFRARPGVLVTAVEIAALVGVSGARQRRLEVQQRGLYLERHCWVTEDGTHHLAWEYQPWREAA